ncbi:hypothetical protein SD74_10080 [Clostridium botulinum]|nr:hypothetical protein NZ45_05135 [Clostridium botulinum]KIN81455.1 hypothetical protein SD74_10080 [Clostridium botulinum]
MNIFLGEGEYISAIGVTTLVIITDYLNIKSINFRKLIDGDLIVLIMYFNKSKTIRIIKEK